MAAEFELGFWPFSILSPHRTILAGDSVRWSNSGDYTYIVESNSRAWETRPFRGEPFEVTFTAPGIYTYNTTWIGPASTRNRGRPGVITVLGWTNVPPRVVLNLPMEGMAFVQGPLLGSEAVELLVSVTGSQETVARIDFYSNGQPIGSDAEPPYGLVFTNATVGEHRLVAKAVERDGRVSESQSVRITVHESLVPLLPPPRVLPTGEVLFHYTGSGLASFLLTRSTNITQFPWQSVLPIRGAGIYVEVPGSAGSQAYFRAERQQ